MKRNFGRIGATVSVAGLTLCGLAATGVGADAGSSTGQVDESGRAARQAVAANEASESTTSTEVQASTTVIEPAADEEETTTTTEAAATTTTAADSEYKEINAITAPPAGFSESACITTDFAGIRLMQYDGSTPTVAVDLPAGRLWISQADSYDAYDSRVYVYQPHETWYLEFIGADGSIVGTSAVTGDVPDNTKHGRWIGSLGIVELSADAVGVRAVHTQDSNEGYPNSVHISSVVMCEEVAEPTTTTTGLDSTTTTEEPPDPTVQPSTIVPTSDAPTTTLTPPDPTVKPATTTPDPTVKPATTTPTTALPVTGSESRALGGAGLSLLLAGGALLFAGRRNPATDA